MKGRLTGAQTTRSETLSCKGQGIADMVAMAGGPAAAWPLHDIASPKSVWYIFQ